MLKKIAPFYFIMNRRIAIIKNTIIQRELGGSIRGWLLNTFSFPATTMSILKIQTVDDSEPEYYKVFIKGHSLPIVIRKSIGINALHHVIAEQLYKWHWHFYEISETTVENGETVFDCGCAEGIFCLLTYNRAGKIYAFEPLTEYLDGLNLTFSNIPKVSIVGEALGNKVGNSYFIKGGIASSISEVKTDYEISINTIDNFCSSNSTEINYIKADIEGYEMQLLNGAKEAIKQFKPKIAITVYHEQNDVEEIKSLLKKIVPEYKFKIKGITNSTRNPVMLHVWI
jgi:FkbM family methyltransferase